MSFMSSYENSAEPEVRKTGMAEIQRTDILLPKKAVKRVS